MSDMVTGNDIHEEELDPGFDSDPEDVLELIEKIEAEYRDTLDVDGLLVGGEQFKGLYTSQMKDGEDTGDVVGEIARLKAALQKAREDTKFHAEGVHVLNQWETLAKIQKRAREPSLSARQSELSADPSVLSVDLVHNQGRSSTVSSDVMFATFPVKEISEKESQQSFESGPEDSGKLAIVMSADFRKAFDINKLLAEHLVLRQKITTFCTRHLTYRGDVPTARETLEFEEKFAHWKAELNAAREESEKRMRDIELLAHWKTLAIMHKRGCKPPSGALSVENTMRLTAENSDSETGPLECSTGSTASKPLDETPISFGGSSGAED